MKRMLFTSVAGYAVALLVGANAWAHQSSSSSTSGQSGSLQKASAQEFFRASDIIGKSAQDTQGTKVGNVKDITFNKNGDVLALVDVGNDKLATVPWPAINTSSAKGSGNITINATQKQLQAGPAVSQNQWGSLDNPAFVKGCYAYYNVQPPSAAAGGASSPGGGSVGQGSSSSISDTNSSSTNSQSQ